MRVLGIMALLWASASFGAEGKIETLANGVKVLTTKDRTYQTGLRRKPAALRGLGETHVALADCGDLPDEFDLRDLGVVPNIKDQGQCGSCWAFSQTASLESAAAAAGKSPLNLSEQELVSCDQEQWGCSGGFLNGFGYQISHGQALEAAFPYTARDSSCRSQLAAAAKGTDYAMVGSSDGGTTATAEQVQCALYKSHTIPWIIVSATNSWSYPPTQSDAVYTSCSRGEPNHAVGVVGWKKINGKVYFKMRNSWGTAWGSDAGRPGSEKGYMMMQLGCDSLGEEVAYIISDNMQCKPPHVKLPAEVSVSAGDEVKLSVRGEAGVDYDWYKGSEKIATGDAAFVSPSADTVYRAVAKNSCGTAESSVRVKVLTFN